MVDHMYTQKEFEMPTSKQLIFSICEIHINKNTVHNRKGQIHKSLNRK